MLRRLAIVGGAFVCTLVLLEALLRVLPVSTATLTGYHVDPDVMGYPPGHRFTVSTGWDLRNPQAHASNNWGFATDIDFLPDARAVALIGDSFVEASMLPASQRPASQLGGLLQGRPVYGMGSPGTALLDYAQRVRLAHASLKVKDFVIWADAGDARQALCGSGFVHSRCLDPATLAPRIERQPAPGLAKRIARHSALLQYVFGQLKIDMGELVRAPFQRVVPVEAPVGRPDQAGAVDDAKLRRAREVIDATLKEFFASIAPYRGGRLVVVVDGRRGGAPAVPDLKELERQYFIKRLREGGAEVVDLQPLFAAHARGSKLSVEVGPYDAHLNGLGVRLAMTETARVFLQRSVP